VCVPESYNTVSPPQISSRRPVGCCTYIFKQGKADDPHDEERKINGEEVERVFDRRKQQDGQGRADGSDGYGVYQAGVCRAIDVVDNAKEPRENAENDDRTAELENSDTRRNNLVSGTHGSGRASHGFLVVYLGVLSGVEGETLDSGLRKDRL
jgi:hypothetical protein